MRRDQIEVDALVPLELSIGGEGIMSEIIRVMSTSSEEEEEEELSIHEAIKQDDYKLVEEILKSDASTKDMCEPGVRDPGNVHE
jgi:hypothetical protein